MIMSDVRWHLIAYDVRDPKRLRQTAKLLEGYGERIQYSIFRCRLDDLTLAKLRWELADILEPEDDLLVIPLCVRCASKIPNHSTGDKTDWTDGPAPFKIL